MRRCAPHKCDTCLPSDHFVCCIKSRLIASSGRHLLSQRKNVPPFRSPFKSVRKWPEAKSAEKCKSRKNPAPIKINWTSTPVQKKPARPECTKIARSSAVAVAIFTAPPQNRAIFKAPRCAISSAKKIASERRFSLRLQGPNLIPTAEFPAIPESAAKIASERRCAILVHSEPVPPPPPKRGILWVRGVFKQTEVTEPKRPRRPQNWRSHFRP